MDVVEILSDYYVSGGFMILETGLILLLVAFLGWNIKLYAEKPKNEDDT